MGNLLSKQVTRFHRNKIIVLGLLLLALLSFNYGGVAHAQGPADATVQQTFTTTTSALVQQNELAAYVKANGLAAQLVQVNLNTLPKISQYTDINSSARGYGYNACGLVAAAAALGGPRWTSLVYSIAHAAGRNYSLYAGIQPSYYVAALQTVFGAKQVAATDDSTLGAVYQALAAGKVVIVDMQVSAYTELPSTRGSVAHFARVLGVDVNKGEIYIQNTLSGGAYWTLSFKQFLQVWDHPEVTASIIPDPRNAEAVTHWMVVLDKTPVAG